MRALVFIVVCIPALCLGQNDEQTLVKQLAASLECVSTETLNVDPDLSGLGEYSDTLSYMVSLHDQAWSTFLSSISATIDDMGLEAGSYDPASDDVQEMGFAPCFADWYFTELELLADLTVAVFESDAGGMAAIVAKSAINKAKYNDCMSNY